MNYPSILLRAVLKKRINRFVAEVILNNETIKVYVPNTGRMSELALPGAELLLSPIKSKYKYKILYIINRSFPVMIDSTYSNRLFHLLLKEQKVPDLDIYTSIKSEPVYGNHRFDFQLSGEKEDLYIELKSCTLFYKHTGAFPDAVSSRASEHVKALAESGKGKLIFFVLRNDIERFLPNYHTDYLFYETLKKYKDRIDIRALAVEYDSDLKIKSLKEIPVIMPDVKPEGIYLLILFNPSDTINTHGEVLEQGWYIWCGKSDGNIFKTIASIKRKNGLKVILTDTRCSGMKVVSDLPVITDCITIDEVKDKLLQHGGSKIMTDNLNEKNEGNNMIYFKTNPAELSWFWNLILELRFAQYNHH